MVLLKSTTSRLCRTIFPRSVIQVQALFSSHTRWFQETRRASGTMATTMQQANNLRRILEEGKASMGMWQMLPGSNVSRTLARTGVDWICVDGEHGNIDGKEFSVSLWGLAISRSLGEAVLLGLLFPYSIVLQYHGVCLCPSVSRRVSKAFLYLFMVWWTILKTSKGVTWMFFVLQFWPPLSRSQLLTISRWSYARGGGGHCSMWN